MPIKQTPYAQNELILNTQCLLGEARDNVMDSRAQCL